MSSVQWKAIDIAKWVEILQMRKAREEVEEQAASSTPTPRASADKPVKVEYSFDEPLPTDSSTGIDYRGVNWMLPSQDKESIRDLMSQVSAASTGSVSGQDLH